MADYLASIYGTEKDKVNCSFYFKIGACRHHDRCARKHTRPQYSQTVLLQNFYANPGHASDCRLSRDELQTHVDRFFEDLFLGLAKYGEIEDMCICDNVSDHLDGNVYVRFAYETQAAAAVAELNNRFYDGRPIWAELSPVTSFDDACCRQYSAGECTRGGLCNFMHLLRVTPAFERGLYRSQRASLRHAASERRRGGSGGDRPRDRERDSRRVERERSVEQTVEESGGSSERWTAGAADGDGAGFRTLSPSAA